MMGKVAFPEEKEEKTQKGFLDQLVGLLSAGCWRYARWSSMSTTRLQA